MFKNILVICVGNICRSPIAEGLLMLAAETEDSEIQVESAGLDAVVGKPADPLSDELARNLGADISAHRARQLTPKMLQSADLVLVMEQWQKEAVVAMHPGCRGKVFNLGHWTGLEITDPFKQPRLEYVEALGKIKVSVDAWRKKIWA